MERLNCPQVCVSVCECVSGNGLVTCPVTAATDSRSLKTLIRKQNG